MINPSKSLYYSGTSGLVLEIPKRSFPEEFRDKSRLQYYASLLNSIEINSSFYKPPMGTTVQKWSESLTGDFTFTFKLWRGITHNKAVAFDPADVQQFIRIINHAGDKKGCLLVQFPASVTINAFGQMEQLMGTIREADPLNEWKVAFEFRSSTWYIPELFETLQYYQMALVIHDHPRSATPLIRSSMDFVYLRFHGPTGDYTGGYTNEFLQMHAAMIRNWIKENKTVYVYFNNTIGDAVQNLFTLNRLLQEPEYRGQ